MKTGFIAGLFYSTALHTEYNGVTKTVLHTQQDKGTGAGAGALPGRREALPELVRLRDKR